MATKTLARGMGTFFKDCEHPQSRWSKCPHEYKIRYRNAAGKQTQEAGFATQDKAISRLTETGPSPVWPPPTGWPSPSAAQPPGAACANNWAAIWTAHASCRTYAQLTSAAALAALAAGGVAWALLEGLGTNALGSLAALLVGAAVLLSVFVGLARLLRIHEFGAMLAMVRGRLGR
ncbi:hypothetical protein ACH4TE_26685 [Streptomyces sioyaensis]|uniref:hypothetical protein n=1 Tax=Streptomyces sioyaensis TaxID=67364 RepID=UPI0037B3A0DA